MPPPADLLLVDDHPVVREGVARLIEREPDLHVAAEAATIEEALGHLEARPFDLALLDIGLAGSSGLDLVEQIRTRWPDLPVLMLSMYHERFYAERALRAGAQGYVMKQQAAGEIVTAVRRVLGGELYLSPELARTLVRRAVDRREGAAAPTEELSNREIEVLRLIGQGLSTREIADHLALSVKTIESYRANLKRKLGLESGTELMRYAYEWARGAAGVGPGEDG